MNVVIIGSGNVAAVLGEKIIAAGHHIPQVAARNRAAAELLATGWGCAYTTKWESIDANADIYIMAISDTAIAGLERGAGIDPPGLHALRDRLVLHTAGSVPKTALLPVSARSGVLYPLQSLRSAVRPYPEIPLLIDANRADDLPEIEAFARTLSGRVRQADDITRLKLHLSAVLVNNFTNYLYTLTKRYCEKEGADFSLLLPLIHETTDRLTRLDPAAMQTGPAVRGDRATIEKHLMLLGNNNEIKELYNLFTIQIEQYYGVIEIPAR